MGQKINSNIFRLGLKQNEWSSKYFEKNVEEFSLYNFKDMEIKKYLTQFLNSQGLTFHSYTLKYTDKLLYVFVSFFIRKDALKKINNELKKKKIKLIRKPKRKVYKKKKAKKRPALIQVYNDSVEKNLYTNNHEKTKNNFINQIFESLSFFTNRKIHTYIIFKNVNQKFFTVLKKQEKTELKGKLLSLRKYSRTSFFKESINTIISALKTKNSSNLLSTHIADQLSKTKKHSYFLVFIGRALKLFVESTFSNIKGIKIVIKGRINGKPRSKKRIIKIGTFPIQSIKSKISYTEATSYTPNGTFGVKVWICDSVLS